MTKKHHNRALRILLGGAATLLIAAGLSASPASPAGPAQAAATATGPVMGYNTWYEYRTSANEADVLKQANLLVSTGLAKLGYNTVNLDDTWMASKRTSAGALTWNTAKFPDGIPSLASKIHAMGLKFGVYEAIGTRTCQNLPGSWGHYAQDAQTFASWGVDFVKVDECGGLSATSVTAVTNDFKSYGADLKKYIPSVVYSEELPIYTYGTSNYVASVQASSTFANMWRVAPDESPLSHASASTMILGHLATDLHLHAFAGPGHWNDLDMVAPGMPASGWTVTDLQNQLAVWAEEASPLLISANLASLTSSELSALGNPTMIAVDSSGAQAPRAITVGHVEALMKAADGGIAVVFVNLGTGTATAKFSLGQFGIEAGEASGLRVWQNRTTTFGAIKTTLARGQTLFMVLKPA